MKLLVISLSLACYNSKTGVLSPFRNFPLRNLRTLFSLKFIRVNQDMFSGSADRNSYASGENVWNVQMPSVSSKGGEAESVHTSSDPDQIRNKRSASHFDSKLPNLITLSLLPKSQWQSLTNLDIIKVRLSLYIKF